MGTTKKLILRNYQSPGDLVMLTAAVRDLKRWHPGEFLIDVRTSCSQIWENNPYLTPLDDGDPEARVITCHYPLIQQSNQLPYHFIHGFIDYLNEVLDLRIRPTAFKGDIHLSEAEKSGPSPVAELAGYEGRYWIVAAGGKQDFTIKWWDIRRYQKVVDHFRGRLQFVQIGAQGHYHPELSGVIDLRARTDLRQLIRLIHHSDGVLTPVNLPMHLAAAIETTEPIEEWRNKPIARPCVVIAGGRESPHWEAYPNHQFLHTVGMLPCCRTGGCWRSRTVPLVDKSEKNHPEHLCVDVVGGLPRCMHMITAENVIERIEMYLAGRVGWPSIDLGLAPRVPVSIKPPIPGGLSRQNARRMQEQFIATIPQPSKQHSGRGIVICAGGYKYFVCAWVCINMLRRLGCTLRSNSGILGSRKSMGR